MTRDEIVSLLKLVVAGDRRGIGVEDVAYWQAMLGPLEFGKAVEALVMIRRREPDKWVDPGHIWQLCSTKTDGEKTGFPELPDCEHGNFCGRCKLVHRVEEPCAVLEARPFPKALPTVVQVMPEVIVESDEPEIVVDVQAVEAERNRQLAELARLAEVEVVDA